MHIKAGDTVVVIAGKDRFTTDKKGKKTRTTGRVLKAYPKLNKVVVEGVNIVKKHERPTQMNESGRILEIEAPIHVSNVMILDPKQNKPTKIGYKEVNGKRVRYAKLSGEILD